MQHLPKHITEIALKSLTNEALVERMWEVRAQLMRDPHNGLVRNLLKNFTKEMTHRGMLNAE